MNLIVDTNIVFYLLAGNKKIESLLNETTVHIPFIVEIELLSHPSIAQKELELIRSFIKDSIQIPYSDSLKELVIKIRRESKVKIPDALREKLFEPFYRIEGEEAKKGLGLGLYIASEIALAHEGDINVTSSDNETVFSFVMPANN